MEIRIQNSGAAYTPYIRHSFRLLVGFLLLLYWSITVILAQLCRHCNCNCNSRESDRYKNSLGYRYGYVTVTLKYQGYALSALLFRGTRGVTGTGTARRGGT